MRRLLVLICCLIVANIYAQQYNQKDYDLVGYYNNKLVYINWNDREKLYYPDFEGNIVLQFRLSELSGDKNLWYINESLRVYHSLKEKETIIKNRGEDVSILSGYELTNRKMIAYSKKENKIILTYDVATTSMLVLYDLTSNSTQFLPIIGRRPVFSNGYLYFSTDHICDWYSAFIDDVYRVKIGDWNNPELILQNTEPTWAVLPNSNIIYADILEDRAKRIFFNADTKTYAITDYIGSSTIINYKGDYYYQIKQYHKPIAVKPIKFAHSYPNKDKRVLCPIEKKILINLSNSEKALPKTFITEDLLYNATKEKLSKLTKEKLRILRNTFYARQGYQFKSNDLQDFFSQFEWYHKMVKRNEFLEITNDMIVIQPFDKERVALIKEIEEQK